MRIPEEAREQLSMRFEVLIASSERAAAAVAAGFCQLRSGLTGLIPIGLLKPVTNQVSTAPGNGRHSATYPDTGIPLNCGNQT